MGDKHKDCTRGYSRLTKAWYASAIIEKEKKDFVDEITIGFYHDEGGTTGEFNVQWTHLGGKIVGQLRAFDDSWDALYNFKDLLEIMVSHDNKNISPDDFEKILLSLDIKDQTSYVAT